MWRQQSCNRNECPKRVSQLPQFPQLLKKIITPDKKKKKTHKVAKATITTHVAGMSVSNIRIDGPRENKKNLLGIENADNLPPGLLIVPTVLDEEAGKRLVRVMNVTDHDIIIKRRHPVARLEDVCLLYTSPSPRDLSTSRMPSSA